MVLGEYIALGGFTVSIVGTLIVTSWRAGKVASEIGHAHKEVTRAVERLERMEERLEEIPEMRTSLKFIQDATARNTSDIKELLEKSAHMRGRFDSSHDGEE